MKKVKDLLLIALFCFCSFVLMGTVHAAGIADKSIFAKDSSGKRMIDMVCEPSKLEKDGDQAECYLIGGLNRANSSDRLENVSGFATHVYTTKHLRLKEAKKNSGIPNTGTYLMNPSATSTTNTDVPADAPATLANYKCRMGDTLNNVTGAVIDKNSVLDYKCAIFYTQKDKENAYTLATLATDKYSNHAYRKGMAASGLGLVGSYVVELEAKEEVKECGEICYMLWDIPTVEDYNNDTCNTPEGRNDEKCKSTSETYKCKEISLIIPEPETPPDDPDTPNTGAFTSYAVLAAGALIAIGAITMAKKNSKFNRI